MLTLEQWALLLAILSFIGGGLYSIWRIRGEFAAAGRHVDAELTAVERGLLERLDALKAAVDADRLQSLERFSAMAQQFAEQKGWREFIQHWQVDHAERNTLEFHHMQTALDDLKAQLRAQGGRSAAPRGGGMDA